MSNKFSDILKDRTIFSEEDEKWIHEEAQKEVQQILKHKHETYNSSKTDVS